MKYPKMNPNIKKMWLKALCSGEYVQGRKRLLTVQENGEHSFCCLGVLCDLHSRETGQKWRERHSVLDGTSLGSYLDCEVMSPMDVDNWSGIDFATQLKLANMNDKGKQSFKAIANWISRNL